MSIDLEKMYALLPAIYRLRDADQGESLKALLSVIAEQVGVIEEDLAQLYDDQFIETCADWVVPYIGDLIGYRTLNDATKFSAPRAEVADTISFRRRKGTAAMLEQLARDVTRWDAHVVEFFLLLATTQYINHLRPNNFYAPDLRKWEPLERLNTAFESIAHTADVRRIASGRGRFNIPNIGIFLFRLGAYSLTESPAVNVDAFRYFFSPLGNNTPLFSRSLYDPEEDVTQLSQPFEVAMPLSRRVLDKYLAKYYGDSKSILLTVDGSKIDIRQITVCDLSDISASQWAHDPPKDKIAIDPVLGRLRFSSANTAPTKVLVTYHYGFAKDMGGGEYERAASFVETVAPTKVKSPAMIQAALTGLTASQVAVEIDDSGRYAEALSINAGANQHIELRAANHSRPTIILQADFAITGGANSEVMLNGLLITNKSITVDGSVEHLRLRHCTLVPGLTLGVDGKPQSSGEPSLIVNSPNTIVEIDNCILGGLRIVDGAQVIVSNSIIDAMAETNVAFAAIDGNSAGGSLQITNSTVVGKIHTNDLVLASNVIFMAALATTDTWTAPVWSERKQEGCVRYSYVPPKSRTPHRFHCQPVGDDDNLRVRPQFTSIHYGDPGYGQLSQRCAVEIRQGADDEAEMGAFHDLFQPQRETNLRVRLDEYLRFGLEAGIIYAT